MAAARDEADGDQFALTHLLRWLAGEARVRTADGGRETADRGPRSGARGAGGVRAPAAPFPTVTMSSLPDGQPPLRPGGLFVAVRGRRDGHDFAADALAHGARAALVARVPDDLQAEVQAGRLAVYDFRSPAQREAFVSGQAPGSAGALLLVDDPLAAIQACAAWWRRRQPARVLAVTGSVGKTTAKELLANTLARRYRVLRTEGNLNNELGLPFMLLRLTPAHERAVLEIGISAVGEMAAFAAIAAPDVAIVTRVAPAHLEQFGDLATVEREKGALVEALPPEGLAILNADDPRVARMAQRTAARIVSYGESAHADVRATEVEALGFDGLGFRLHRGGRSERVRVPLVGRHFVAAALAAAAAAFEEGCPWDAVVAGLAQPPATGRLRPRRLANGATVLDDAYNASPAAVMAALDVLAAGRGRRVAVLGDMLELGAAGAAAHRDVGRYVPGRADELVAVGDLAGHIAAGAREAGLAPDRAHVFAGNAAALAFLRARLAAGDSVLVKGSRSAHMDEIVRGLTDEPESGGAH